MLLVLSTNEAVVQAHFPDVAFVWHSCVGRVISPSCHAGPTPRPEGDVGGVVRLYLCGRRRVRTPSDADGSSLLFLGVVLAVLVAVLVDTAG